MPNAAAVKVGPGKLYFAELGSTEPTDTVVGGKFTDAWGVDWTEAGYTDEGHTFTRSPSVDPVEVAESKTPIRYYNGSTEYTVEFSLAEMTAENLQRALNGGTITTSTGVKVFEPPAPDDDPVRLMIGWESDDHTERWIYRQAFQSGDSGIARKKGPDKATIPMSFQLEQPEDNSKPFRASFAQSA